MRYLTPHGVIKFGRSKKIVLSMVLIIALLALFGTVIHARGLMVQLITLVADETATVVCDGGNLNLLSQTEQQMEISCAKLPDPTPEPTNTPAPSPTDTPEPPDNALMPALVSPTGSNTFDPRQIPIEIQSWWMPDYGHIHAAANLPVGQEIGDKLNFDVRIVLHHNPSHLYKLRFDVYNDPGSTVASYDLDAICPQNTPEKTCAFNVPVSLDTSKWGTGWKMLRIRATVETPDGKRFTTSSEVPLFIPGGGDNGNHCIEDCLIGKGWYDGIGYALAQFKEIPLQPVSGVHTFHVRAFKKPSNHLTVNLDSSHFVLAVAPWPEVPPTSGVTLFDQDGDFKDYIPIEIDTTKLANGWHSIAVRTTSPQGEVSNCDTCSGELNHLEGVAKVWFFVQN